jgi:hypothetical protein
MSIPLVSLVPTVTDLNLLQCYLADKTLYAHLVTELPGIDVEVAAGCSLSTGGKYTPLELIIVLVKTSANGGAEVFADNVVWIGFTNNGDPVKGVAIFIQQGSTKSGSDALFSTLALVDEARLISPIIPDGANFSVNFSEIPLFRTRHDQ